MRFNPIAKLVLILVLAVSLSPGLYGQGNDAPNILWITAEDMSATLGCYGDDYAVTPNIDQFAKESVRYTHAFASAPICSPARSCLITGRYAPSLGTQQMRSAFPIPDRMKGFPSLMRDRGYYTSNNAKTDYNTANFQAIIEASWDESSQTAHWRKREEEQAFFSIFNLMTSHQSRTMVWPREQFINEVQSRLTPEEIHDLSKAPVPPYYPDTTIIRRTIARYYDCVTAMDKEVGAILEQLEEDGLADETIVFFYSDHGSGMPRHKRALLDSGMHVPLLIRFPEKYQHLAPARPGETIDRLVSFVDFGPTVLSLAGVEIPDDMQGRPFLGSQADSPRKRVYGHRDRVDEVLDVARSVRTHRYLYIRNYMPHLGYNQPSAWPEQGAIRGVFDRLTNPETLTEAQWHFAGPTRPIEELYDCQADPMNLNNLAGSAEHQDVLKRMRRAHRRNLRRTRDLGFIPESEAWKLFSETTPWTAARAGEVELKPLYEAASQVGVAGEKTFLQQLGSENGSVRYWGAIGLAGRERLSSEALQRLEDNLNDPSMAVRIEAANVLARNQQIDKSLPVLTKALQHKSLTVVLHAARTIELLGDAAKEAVPAMEQVLARAHEIRSPDTPATEVEPGDQDMAMFIGFAAEGFLSRVKAGDWKQLFDGESLEGWTARAPGDIEVKEGEIQMLAEGDNLWLVHEDEYEDFELLVEARMPETYNSGIGFRCSGEDGKPKGYQCEIDGKESGMIYAIGSGWVWPRGEQEREQFFQKAGDTLREDNWNVFRIRCEGDHIQVWVNGIKTTDIHDALFARGYMALQHHGRGGVHRFRNIWVRELQE